MGGIKLVSAAFHLKWKDLPFILKCKQRKVNTCFKVAPTVGVLCCINGREENEVIDKNFSMQVFLHMLFGSPSIDRFSGIF